MKLREHIEELRARLIKVSVVFFSSLILGFFLSPAIIRLILDSLPGNIRIITTYPLEVLVTEARLSFYISLLLAIPFSIHELSEFVKPSLKKNEKKFLSIIPVSVLLFYLGFILGYFVLFILGIKFLSSQVLSIGLSNLWGLEKTISYLFTGCFLMGLCFQLPLIILILNKLNLVKKAFLRKKRKIIYILIITLVAIITPSVDPFTLIIVSVPHVLLYEISLLMRNLF